MLLSLPTALFGWPITHATRARQAGRPATYSSRAFSMSIPQPSLVLGSSWVQIDPSLTTSFWEKQFLIYECWIYVNQVDQDYQTTSESSVLEHVLDLSSVRWQQYTSFNSSHCPSAKLLRYLSQQWNDQYNWVVFFKLLTSSWHRFQ